MKRTLLGLTNQYLVYPNPFVDKVTLEYLGSKLKEKIIEVYNLHGQRVLRPSFRHKESGSVELDLSPLTSGKYYLLIRQNDQTTFKKLIK